MEIELGVKNGFLYLGNASRNVYTEYQRHRLSDFRKYLVLAFDGHWREFVFLKNLDEIESDSEKTNIGKCAAAPVTLLRNLEA